MGKQTKFKSNWQVLIPVLSTKLWEEIFNPFLFQMNLMKGPQGASVVLSSTSRGCRAHWKFPHLNLQRVQVFINTGPHFSQTNRSFLSSCYCFLLKTKVSTQSFCDLSRVSSIPGRLLGYQQQNKNRELKTLKNETGKTIYFCFYRSNFLKLALALNLLISICPSWRVQLDVF